MNSTWIAKIEIDKSNKKAVYMQIADEVISAIKRGLLQSGETLPGTRQLALLLKVNRNTIIKAFDILLSEGWLHSEERKKIFVSDKLSITPPPEKTELHPDTTEIYRNDLIFFDDGLPDVTCTPIKELARAYRRIFSRKAKWQIMNLASELGDEKFRDTLSGMLNANRGMHTSASQLCITRGSQMALYLTAHSLLQKGDHVLIENPGYRPAWDAFISAGATLIPVPVDQDGIQVETIVAMLKKKRVKAIYITPHHQYPTTVTLSLARRLQLIELSNKYHFTIIEDDYDNEFHFGQRPIMPLSAYEETINYVYIGTLSKLIAPAVRIGYVVSSPHFIARVGKLRKIIDMQGDAVMEQSILDLIVSGDVRRHQKRMLNHYKAKRDFFSHIIDYYLKDKVTYEIPDGGLAFWLKPVNAANLFQLKNTVNTQLISFYTPDRFSHDNPIMGLRLGYASLPESSLEKGIQILSQHL